MSRFRPPVSIVVLTFNGLDMTRTCIDRLSATTEDYELIVVENGSSDGTVEYVRGLEREDERIRAVYNASNRGFAKGCNQGVRMAQHEHVCLLNNDTEPSVGWLDAMRDVFDKDVGAVGAKLLYPDNTIQHAGMVFVYRPGLMPHFLPDHRFRFAPSDLPEANVLEEVPAVTAACLLTTKHVWERVKGMDVAYGRAYYEDVDFNLKVRDTGWKVLYQPAATLVHKEKGTTSALAGTPDDLDRTFARNHRRYVERWNKRLFLGLATCSESQ
ncbi:MAG: glycosyltransferase family 2 protein [Actinomycetota bacterium]|nr:glycosyltransferase family 2 protein [Actinomycetota bacterium]